MMESKDKLPGKKPQSGVGRGQMRGCGARWEPWRRLRGHVEFELLHCLNPGLVHPSPLRREDHRASAFLTVQALETPPHWRPCSLEACPLEVQSGCLGNPPAAVFRAWRAAGERGCHSNGGACPARHPERSVHPADADAVAPETRGPLRHRARRGSEASSRGGSVGSSCLAVGFQIQHLKALGGTFSSVQSLSRVEPL